jgi:hypothetical protein
VNRIFLIKSLVLLCIFCAQAQAAVTVTPPNPIRGESVTISSDQPGWIHWGVNGWRVPGSDDQPLNSRFELGAVESRLHGQGPNYAVTLGPFRQARVHELNFVLRLDNGQWAGGPNSGGDGRVVFSSPDKNTQRPITIGRGPRLGFTAGQDFYEEFQDWSHGDARALDRAFDRRTLSDGGDDSRDLIAFYSRREKDQLFMRVDFFDLALAAEKKLLNVAILIDTQSGGQEWLPDFVLGRSQHPWELAIVVEDSQRYKVFNAAWQTVVAPGQNAQLWNGAYFRSDLDAMECGLSLQVLRDHGWDGRSELRFQVVSYKPGHNEMADAIGEGNIYDRRLDDVIAESAGVSTVKYSAILHGNQAVKRASEIYELIRNDQIKTPAGHPTGYHRALETHDIFNAPVNIHVSGTLAASFQWASHANGGQDGPSFNNWIEHLVKTDRAALIGGVLAEHIAPYFEKSGVNEASVRLNHKALGDIYQSAEPRIFWTPERVIRAATFADIRSAGYEWTIVDQHNHIWNWFGKQDALSNNGYKINRINGVNCFLINDEPDQLKFAVTDGGAFNKTREILLGKALDKDQEQLIIVFDDWEAYSGRSFTSFGKGNDNPDNYNLNIRWMANHPWIQIVTLDEVASWNWKAVDRGQSTSLDLTTYHWLNHATETDYDGWYYGSNQEESFANQYPLLNGGQRASKRFGDVWTAGTLFHDTWKDVESAPAGPLKDLAEAVYSTAIFETAWHDEDQHDYHSRDSNGQYLAPDRSYDRISDWAYGMHNKVRDASIVAAAAQWAAAKPLSKTIVEQRDVDQDGERETVLSNNRVFAVFENDGGRLVMAFGRRLRDGRAYNIIGASIVDPGAHRESEVEGDFRVSGLRDQWASGTQSSRYVNADYTVQLLSRGLSLSSDDGRIVKTIELGDDSDRLSVAYQVEPGLGTLSVRTGFCPNLLRLFSAGQGAMQLVKGANRIGVRTNAKDATVQGMIEGRGVTEKVRDGGAIDNGRNAALTQQLEIAGSGQFQFTIILSVW